MENKEGTEEDNEALMTHSSPEHVVGVAALVQQVDPGAHIVRILAVGDELQVKTALAVNIYAIGVLKLDRIYQLDHESRYNGQIKSEAKVREYTNHMKF